VDEDTSGAGFAPTAFVTDADGDTLTMTITLDHGTIERLPSEVIDGYVEAHQLTLVDDDGSDHTLTFTGSAEALSAIFAAGGTYTPDLNFNGTDHAVVTVTDGHDHTATASVEIHVNPVNDVPTLLTGSVTGAVPNGTLTGVAASYLTADHTLIDNLGGPVGFGDVVSFVGGGDPVIRNDDLSTAAINIDSVFGSGGLNFFGTTYHSIFINNNGNITFGEGLTTFTPTSIPAGLLTGTGAPNPIIAAFWADVDTRNLDSGLVYYNLDTDNHVLTITWDDVGYFSTHSDKLNSFQLQLIGLGNGDFDIVFRYEDINWTTGDASGGAGGLDDGNPGTQTSPARAGYAAGDGVHSSEISGSGDQGAVLAWDTTTGNTGIVGVDVFQVESGEVTTAPVANGTIAFADPDTSDIHTASFGSTGESYLGHFTIDAVSETTNTVGWHFTLGTDEINQFFDSEATSVREQDYTVTINDGNPGGSVTQTVGLNVASADSDTFVFAPAAGQQVIFKFDTAEDGGDHIDLADFDPQFDSLADALAGGMVQSVNDGHDTLIDLGHGDSITLINTQTTSLQESNFTWHHLLVA
jgi:hypothetical protein